MLSMGKLTFNPILSLYTTEAPLLYTKKSRGALREGPLHNNSIPSETETKVV